MNNERTLYISPEDDLPTICTRLEHAHSRRVILVMPIDAEHMHAFGNWRMLHAYTRRRGIRVHIVSTNTYFRSIARSARFTVSKTFDAPQQEKPRRPRPSTHRSSPVASIKDMNVEEGVNLVFLADNESSTPQLRQERPYVQPLDMPTTLMFTDDDVLFPPPHPEEPPVVRVAKPPQPLSMPRMRRTRPLAQPRLPWDDVDDELLPPRPLHKPIKRRTNPLVQSMVQRRGAIRGNQHRREDASIFSFSPLLCIGIFIVARSIVQYLKKK